MAAVRHLGFVGESGGGTTHEGRFIMAIICKKFRQDGRSNVEVINID